MSAHPDKAESVAFNASAPQGERTQALGELQKTYAPSSLAGMIMPREDLKEVISYIADEWGDAQMSKAMNGNVVPFPSKNSKERKPGMQSVSLDNLQISTHGDYWEKPSAFGFDSMRMMVDQTPILNAVIMTRIRQVQAFCKVNETGEGAGFVIRHMDKDHQITPSEKESINLMQRFIVNCGWEFNPRARRRLKRDSFAQMMAKLTRDSLTMDSAPIETEMKRDKKQGIDGLYAVDGATIRLCTEHGYQGDDELYALQVVQGRISAAYTHDDLIYEVRNPQTSVLSAGYGIGETELMIRVVTGFLNAMTINIKGFSDNAIPKGMLHLSGDYDTKDLNAFKRYWNGMVKGVNNAWSLPVMISKDQESKASFENFGNEFNEMYFAKWMTFLTSIICAIYGMSPSEINFDSFTGGSTSALAGSDTAAKLAASKDSGLHPLLTHFSSTISDFVVSDFSDKYCFRWTGIDDDDSEKREERSRLIMTVNEMRAQDGLDAMEGPLGDAPLNPALIGPWQQIMQAQQPEDFGQAPDDGGQGGTPGGDDDQEPGDGDPEEGGAAPGQDQDPNSGDAKPGAAAQAPGGPGLPDAQMTKANPNHDPETGRFGVRTHEVRLEKRKLHELYEFALNHPLADPGAALVTIDKNGLAMQMEKGPAVEKADGSIKVAGGKLGNGYGMVKVVWKHGEKSGKPAHAMVQKSDVLALPEVVRSAPTSVAVDDEGESLKWEWRRSRHDGSTVVYAASRFSAGDNKNHVVTIHVEQEMRKAGMCAADDFCGLTPQLPADVLSVAASAVGPLTVYYADPDENVNLSKALPSIGMIHTLGLP